MEKCFVSIFLLFFKDTSIFKKSIETYNTYSSEYSRLIEDASFFCECFCINVPEKDGFSRCFEGV